MAHDTSQDNLGLQISLITQAMREHGIDSATVEYAGSGDSGDFFDVTLDKQTDAKVSIDGRTMSLQDAVSHVADSLIEELHSGYEIDSGGGGTLNWLSDGSIVLKGYINYEAGSEESAHIVAAKAEQTVPDRHDENSINTRRLIDALRAAGATRAEVAYSGGGDSGGVDEVTIEPASARKDLQVDIWDHVFSFDGPGRCFQKRMSLSDALSYVANDFLSDHFGGWENNEGGSGTITFNLDEECVEISHTDYHDEQEYFDVLVLDPALSRDNAIALMRRHQDEKCRTFFLCEEHEALYKALSNGDLDLVPDHDESLDNAPRP